MASIPPCEPGESSPRTRTISEGEAFGRWTALEAWDWSMDTRRALCRCECGTERAVMTGSLIRGKSRSCGCNIGGRTVRRCVRPRIPDKPYIVAGTVAGRLTALEDAMYSSDKVRCSCECGRNTKRFANSLKGGTAQSCGCLKREATTTHGLSGHPLFRTWQGMIRRTSNPRDNDYPAYGGRGIAVCERWQGLPDGYLNFAADVGERPVGTTLDRVDNDGNYEPGNVCWGSPSQQSRNRRTVAALTRERAELQIQLQAVTEALAQSREASF